MGVEMSAVDCTNELQVGGAIWNASQSQWNVPLVNRG